MLLSEEDEELIRRYFLGDVTEEEKRYFEERVFVHEAFKTHTLIVEDELFEDYAAHLLPKAEREKFERHMLRTPAAREKLNIIGAMLVHQKPALPVPAPAVLPSSISLWQRFSWLRFARQLPAWAMAFTAILLVALLAGGVWYFYRDRGGLTDTARRQQLESEIAALNRQSLQLSGRQDLLDVTLTPGQVRGDDLQTKLTVPEKGLTIRFHLLLPPGREPRGLRVIVLNGENAEVFSYDPSNSTDQKELVLDVPGHAFGPDDYIIKLRDISTGHDVAGGDYSFRVKRP